MLYMIQVFNNGDWEHYWLAFTLRRARYWLQSAWETGYPARVIDIETGEQVELFNKNGQG